MAQNVAQKALGADLEGTEFWKRAIMSHASDLAQFEKLVKKVLG